MNAARLDCAAVMLMNLPLSSCLQTMMGLKPMITVTLVWHKGPFTSSDCDVAATSLPNLINCFGVALLHLATAMSLGKCFVSHWERCRSDIADASLSLDVNGL